MKRIRATAPLSSLITFLALAGCGGTPPPISPPLNLTPNGNWLLAGNEVTAQYPIVTSALFVNGNQVTLNGFLWTNCSPGLGGFTFYQSGTIAPDGSFQTGGQPADIISINGVVPGSGATTWSGTYYIGAVGGCIVNQGAPFTATVLPAYNGTYAGTLSDGIPSGNISFSASFTQGAVTSASVLGVPYYYLPLSATLAVGGLPCFTQGTSIAGYSGTYAPWFISSASGLQIGGAATMNDGSQALFTGTFWVPDESSVDIAIQFSGGKCDLTYGGTLTRQ
jgi:hypothetical protein